MKQCPKCGSSKEVQWCYGDCYGGKGHWCCFECGWQTGMPYHSEHRKPKKYMFNLDENSLENNIHEILQRLSYIEEQQDAMIYTLENHTDVDRCSSKLHMLIRSGYDAEIIVRRKRRD